MSTKNYKLIIAYDGTQYGGWQVQQNSITIQQLLEEAIKTVARENVHVNGSGRTDAGVHALAQVANFKCTQELSLHSFVKSLNGILPYDIRVLSMTEVPLDFHARFSATKKCYYYNLWLDPVQLPFQRLYSWHIKQRFDTDKLREAAQQFLGRHNFSAFANKAHSGSAATDPVRTLFRLDIIEQNGGIRLEFEADGFLYKMVRNIVGTLHDVSTGKKSPKHVSLILESKDRRRGGQAAPAHGLFLAHVDYDNV